MGGAFCELVCQTIDLCKELRNSEKTEKHLLYLEFRSKKVVIRAWLRLISDVLQRFMLVQR